MIILITMIEFHNKKRTQTKLKIILSENMLESSSSKQVKFGFSSLRCASHLSTDMRILCPYMHIYIRIYRCQIYIPVGLYVYMPIHVRAYAHISHARTRQRHTHTHQFVIYAHTCEYIHSHICTQHTYAHIHVQIHVYAHRYWCK